MYAKIFKSLYQGTLRGNSHGILVFTNLLAHADARGEVDLHPRAIAEEVGLSVDQVRAALIELESPDEESRSFEHEGRRLIRLDTHRSWGWLIVNYAKYRAIRSEDDRKEQNRRAQEKFRMKKVSQGKPRSAQEEEEAEAEAEAEEKITNSKRRRKTSISIDLKLTDEMDAYAKSRWAEASRHDLNAQDQFQKFHDYHTAKGSLMADWKSAWRTWVSNAIQYTKPQYTGGDYAIANRTTRTDNSAAGRVRAAIARERAAEAAAAQRNTGTVANDGLDVWAQMDNVLRG